MKPPPIPHIVIEDRAKHLHRFVATLFGIRRTRGGYRITLVTPAITGNIVGAKRVWLEDEAGEVVVDATDLHDYENRLTTGNYVKLFLDIEA